MIEVVLLYYNDIRTYERAFEGFFQKLQAIGAEFVNGEVEGIEAQEEGRLKMRVALGEGAEPDLEDMALEDGTMVLDSDMVVLAAAQRPRAGLTPLLEQLGVQTDRHGYPMESQVRLFRPTESMVDRV